MKRPNDFNNADFDPALLIEAWKLIIFESEEMDPESAASLSSTSSFFYELICQSNQKETREQQQLFWKNHVVEEFGDIVDEDDVKTVDWKDLYGSTTTEHINNLAMLNKRILDYEVMASAHFSELQRQLSDINNQCADMNNQLADINNMF